MKTSLTYNASIIVKSVFTVIILFLAPSLFGQNTNHQDSTSTIAMSKSHKSSSDTKNHSSNQGKTATTVHHHALSTHKVFHHRAPATLTTDNLITGNTYNRYGEKANPKGYGIQVITFKKIKNLQRFLHTYHKKDMYVQVILLDTKEQMYRVILGADENKSLIEKEISLFQNAGVSAVLRKHK